MSWKNTGTMSDGISYEYYQQDQACSCGPATVATLICHMQNKKIDTSTIGVWFGQSEGSVNITKSGIRDFTLTGSWYDGAIGALSKLKIYANVTKGFDNPSKWAKKVTKNKPGILSVGWYQQNPNGTWSRNGGHWVVALKTHNNHIICLDPLLDNAGNEISFGDLPEYQCNYGNGLVTGYIDGIILP